MRLNVIHLLFNAYAHFFVRNLFFIASFLLAYFQSHAQNAMHWHAQSPVNYFRFWENIYFLSFSRPIRCVPVDVQQMGQI